MFKNALQPSKKKRKRRFGRISAQLSKNWGHREMGCILFQQPSGSSHTGPLGCFSKRSTFSLQYPVMLFVFCVCNIFHPEFGTTFSVPLFQCPARILPNQNHTLHIKLHTFHQSLHPLAQHSTHTTSITISMRKENILSQKSVWWKISALKSKVWYYQLISQWNKNIKQAGITWNYVRIFMLW